MAIIYLSRLRRESICLPCTVTDAAKPVGIERAALQRYYTWHFSMQGLPAIDVAIKSRELLPHVFTFTRQEASAVILCGTVSPRLLGRGPRYSWGALPYAVRTFLPSFKTRSDNPACSNWQK